MEIGARHRHPASVTDQQPLRTRQTSNCVSADGADCDSHSWSVGHAGCSSSDATGGVVGLLDVPPDNGVSSSSCRSARTETAGREQTVQPSQPISVRRVLKEHRHELNRLEREELSRRVTSDFDDNTVYYMGLRADKPDCDDLSAYGDEDGRYKFVPADHLDWRYEMVSVAPCCDGRLIVSIDHRSGAHVFIKPLRMDKTFPHRCLDDDVEVFDSLSDLFDRYPPDSLPIVRPIDIFTFRRHDFIVFPGRELNLSGCINERQGRPMEDDDILNVARCLIDLLRILGEKQLVLGDLAADSVMMADANSGQVQVIDCGRAASTRTKGHAKSVCRRADVTAPEILNGKPFGPAADVFSLGQLLAVMHSGHKLSFDEAKNLFEGQYVEGSLRHFIQGCVWADPVRRWSLDEAASDHWVRRDGWTPLALIRPWYLTWAAGYVVDSASARLSALRSHASRAVGYAPAGAGDSKQQRRPLQIGYYCDRPGYSAYLGVCSGSDEQLYPDGYTDKDRHLVIHPDGHINERYQPLELLSRTQTAQVVRAWDHLQGTQVAVKVFAQTKDRRLNECEMVPLLEKDLAISERPYANTPLDKFSFRGHDGLVYSLYHKSLKDLLAERLVRDDPQQSPDRCRGLDYDTLRKLTRSIVQCLAVLHRHHIVHGDLRPEHIMIKNESALGDVDNLTIPVAIVGFSQADDTENGWLKRGPRGYSRRRGGLDPEEIVYYQAPEYHPDDYYGPRADMFSLGYILAELRLGRKFNKLQDGDGGQEQERWAVRKHFHDEDALFVDFVNRCLNFQNADERLTADQAMAHDWLHVGDHWVPASLPDSPPEPMEPPSLCTVM